MDLQRSFLIGSLIIVSILMVRAWQEDYAHVTVNPEVEKTRISEIPKTLDETAEIIAIDVNESDIPQAVSVSSVQNSLLPEANTTTESLRLISVKSDLLELEIDTYGGDIVYAAFSAYSRSIDTPDAPYIFLENSSRRTFIAQSGLIGKNGTDKGKERPLFKTTQYNYQMNEGLNSLDIDFFYTQKDGTELIKRFTLERGSYLVKVSYLVHNNSQSPWSGTLYSQFKRDKSKDPSADGASPFGMATYLGAAYWADEKPYNKYDFDDIEELDLKQLEKGGWMAWIQHYFVSAWIPAAESNNQFFTRYQKKSGNYLAGFVSEGITIESGARGELSASLYIGPKIQKNLEKISTGLELTVDYGWLWFIAQPLFWLLTQIQSFVVNWGFAIILLTLVIKLAFFQLSAASYRSMANMRRVTPEITRIREEYKNDKQKQSVEMMNLYKKEKINPLGGCLPILVQMPVFISLYWVLMESVELRQSPFIFWIQDLSIMDPYFVLPAIMGASMFLQTQLNPTPPDPMQAKVMKWMPVIFTFFFLFFPAGLVLYWVTNNVLSIAQQWVITKNIEKAAAAK